MAMASDLLILHYGDMVVMEVTVMVAMEDMVATDMDITAMASDLLILNHMVIMAMEVTVMVAMEVMVDMEDIMAMASDLLMLLQLLILIDFPNSTEPRPIYCPSLTRSIKAPCDYVLSITS